VNPKHEENYDNKQHTYDPASSGAPHRAGESLSRVRSLKRVTQAMLQMKKINIMEFSLLFGSRRNSYVTAYSACTCAHSCRRGSVVRPSRVVTSLAHERLIANKSDHCRRSYRQHGVNGFGRMPLLRLSLARAWNRTSHALAPVKCVSLFLRTRARAWSGAVGERKALNKPRPLKVQRSTTTSAMKKLLLAFALTFLLSPFAPQANSQDVSVDFFYNNLNGGSWIEVGNYGYCWQPDIVVSDPSWRPYADGYWAYTDLGWTWVSYEDFGWATYHYGRWVRLADYGWVWVPGYHWGPAWVSWRFGGGYCGWAPLPPETEFVYESRPLTGHLDVEFDIGPAYYNFVDVRYIGEPVLRSRIVPYEQNITYVTETVNVTNITYKNKTVYEYGPDLNTVNQYSNRPVQTLKLERQTNVDVATAAKSGGLTKVQGNALVVAAPPEIKKPAATPAPPAVKAKVQQPKIEKGWSVAGDENAQKQLKEKIKTQDLKKVPPPAAGGNAAAAAGDNASVAPGTSPAIAASPFEKEKGKGKQAEQFQAGAATSPVTAPNTAASASVTPEYGKRGKGKGREQIGGTAMTPAPTAGEEGIAKPEGKRRGFERQNVGPTPGAPANSSENLNESRGKLKHFEQPGMSPAGSQNPPAGPYGEGRGKHKAEAVNAPPGGGAQPQGGQPGEKQREGKGKAQGQSPTPGP